MRHHQKTLHTLLHHPLQPFPGCREGSWEGGYDCWEGGKELVKKGVGGADLVGFWLDFLFGRIIVKRRWPSP